MGCALRKPISWGVCVPVNFHKSNSESLTPTIWREKGRQRHGHSDGYFTSEFHSEPQAFRITLYFTFRSKGVMGLTGHTGMQDFTPAVLWSWKGSKTRMYLSLHVGLFWKVWSLSSIFLNSSVLCCALSLPYHCIGALVWWKQWMLLLKGPWRLSSCWARVVLGLNCMGSVLQYFWCVCYKSRWQTQNNWHGPTVFPGTSSAQETRLEGRECGACANRTKEVAKRTSTSRVTMRK